MIISKAPLRLGLSGGGTDIADFSALHGGAVLNATISLYTYCFVEEINSETEFVSLEHNEKCTESEFELGSFKFLKYAYSIKQYFDDNYGQIDNLRISTYSEAPYGSGLGGSSSLTVAIIEALRRHYNVMMSKYEIADLAVQIERVKMNMSGGLQDQYAAAFGGFNFMEFNGMKVEVNPLRINDNFRQQLLSKMVCYFSGSSRDSEQIIESQKSSLSDKISYYKEIKQNCMQAKSAILREDYPGFLDLFNEAWLLKQSTSSNISNKYIQNVEKSLKALDGFEGLKISGAGGGGFMLIFTQVKSRFKILEHLNTLEGGTFNIEFTNQGVISWKTK